jgi:hypothetical protein
MPAKEIDLYNYFRPDEYTLDCSQDICHLLVLGNKIGPPSKRITLHQKKLRILSADIARVGKNPGQFKVARINHLPTVGQVRLHTKEMLYPGSYQVSITYQLKPEAIKKLKNLGDKTPNRLLLPCVDTPFAWADAAVEIKL